MYSYVEYTNLADIYLQGLKNPNLNYIIEVMIDFSTLFTVINKISANVEIHRNFNNYQKAQKFAQQSNGYLKANALAFKVEYIDLTDDTQTDYYTEEFNSYEDALKFHQWIASHKKMRVKPIIHKNYE